MEIKAECPTLVLIETICILNRRIKNKDFARKIYQKLSFLPSINWLPLTQEAAENACEIGIQTSLKGADSIILQVAEQYGIPILTKDKEFKEKAPKNILIFEPNEIHLN